MHSHCKVSKSCCKTQFLQIGLSPPNIPQRKAWPLGKQNTSERACSDKYRARRLRGKQLRDTHLGCQIMALAVSSTPMHLFRSRLVVTGSILFWPTQIPLSVTSPWMRQKLHLSLSTSLAYNVAPAPAFRLISIVAFVGGIMVLPMQLGGGLSSRGFNS